MRAAMKSLSRRGKVTIGGTAIAVIACAGTGVAWGTGAFTSSIPDASGVIHACYDTNGNGTLKNVHLIDPSAGATCPNGSAPLSWNQTGPAGPTGPQGGTGPSGPSGPARPIAVTQRLGAQTLIDAGSYGSVSADCLSGEVAVGGGLDGTQSEGFYLVSSFEMQDGGVQSWKLVLRNSTGQDAVRVEAVAECLQP